MKERPGDLLHLSGDPIGYENIEFPFGGRVAVRGPHELFPIFREHGETIEIALKRNLFGFAAIVSNHMKVKGWTPLMLGWGGEV